MLRILALFLLTSAVTHLSLATEQTTLPQTGFDTYSFQEANNRLSENAIIPDDHYLNLENLFESSNLNTSEIFHQYSTRSPLIDWTIKTQFIKSIYGVLNHNGQILTKFIEKQRAPQFVTGRQKDIHYLFAALEMYSGLTDRWTPGGMNSSKNIDEFQKEFSLNKKDAQNVLRAFRVFHRGSYCLLILQSEFLRQSRLKNIDAKPELSKLNSSIQGYLFLTVGNDLFVINGRSIFIELQKMISEI